MAHGPAASGQNRPAAWQPRAKTGRLAAQGPDRPAGSPEPKTGRPPQPRRSARLGVRKMTTVPQKSHATSPRIFLKALALPCQTEPEPRPLPEMCISLNKMTTLAKTQLDEQARWLPKAHFASQNTCFQQATDLPVQNIKFPGSEFYAPGQTIANLCEHDFFSNSGPSRAQAQSASVGFSLGRAAASQPQAC